MLAKALGCAVVGLEGALVEVEVDIASGLPAFNIVGLPDAAVQEARERVRAAVRNSGGAFPMRRITVNLAPAELRKVGTSYDLPIAIGLLFASEQVAAPAEAAMFIGELSLDGGVRHTNGVLAMAVAARDHGIGTVFVPVADADEAALVQGVSVIAIGSLAELVRYLRGEAIIAPHRREAAPTEAPSYAIDMAHVKGQEHVKRALEVAAAGGHNVLMLGPPGSGKTLLARAMPSILPRLTFDEALEVTQIYSVAGLLRGGGALVQERPFRAPHHTISHAGLVGGGRMPKPGEITLSHRGVLFLDELPEFGHAGLEVLRQPMEDRIVTISRAQGSATFPASFIMVGAMNPCPCGYLGDPLRACTCSASTVAHYQKRISGPLLDRIDIFVEVPRVAYEKLTDDRAGEPSAAVRERVESARTVQRRRFVGGRLSCNAEMTPVEVHEFCRLDAASQGLLRAAMGQLHLSARAFHRILKVARTIADLADADGIAVAHLAESIQYRPRGWG